MEDAFSGQRVTVMGLGTFGAGIAVVRFFAERGALVTVTDLRSAEELAGSVTALAGLDSVRFRLGGHDERDFADVDVLVISPAVKPNNPFVARAAAAGATITSELRLFWQRCRAPIVGVTGSNGKSTTATLIHDMLKADGRRVWLGGNIGRSLLNLAADIRPTDWVVLELSSFQLADLETARVSPHVAIITNFTPNHLDWHGTLSEYAAAKQTILRWQSPRDIAVRLHGSLEAGWPTRAANCWYGGEHDDCCSVRMSSDRSSLLLPGNHIVNLADCPGLPWAHARCNAVAAAAAALSVGVERDAIASALHSFAGLPHRLEFVRGWQGRRFINDSASTTPESTVMALTAFADGSPILIAGGADKGCDLAPLALAISKHAHAAVLFGDAARSLTAEIERAAGCVRRGDHTSSLPPVARYDTLASAVDAAVGQSQPGDTILFSPGFSSGSMFTNYDARGRAFVDLVKSLPARIR